MISGHWYLVTGLFARFFDNFLDMISYTKMDHLKKVILKKKERLVYPYRALY